MAAAVHKLLHPIEHHRSKEENSQTNQSSSSAHDRQDSAMDRARDEEKRSLAQWQDLKTPLEPGQIDEDPDRKMVGHSSDVLRQDDFELIKTLGTGAHKPALGREPRC